MNNEDGMGHRAKSECARLSDQVPSQALLAIGRAYRRGDFTKPLEELTDEEVLAAQGCGPATLRELRRVFSEPSA